MTTIGAAYNKFLSGLGLPAYAETAVPDDAEFPYLTYELVTGEFNSGEITTAVNIWDRTPSEAAMNEKAQRLFDMVGLGGVILTFEGGNMWIKRGTPFSQAAPTEDDSVKRRYILLDIEFNTI